MKSGDMQAMVSKDKLDVHMLTIIIHQQKVIFPMTVNVKESAIVEDYSHHVGDTDESDRMANSYSISQVISK
jgi:hypothetical protein